MNRIKTFNQFLQKIKDYRNKTALVRLRDNTEISYQNLISEIENLSYYINSQIELGDRVIINQQTDIDWVKSFFAIILAGGIAVSIDSRVSDNMFQDILELTSPSLILNKPNKSVSGHYRQFTLTDLESQKYPKVNLPEPNPDFPCEIIFTSGTWAKPKGVTLSQANLLSNLDAIINYLYTPKQDERFLSILPLAHIYEQTIGLLVPLYAKCTIYYLDQITPVGFRKALAKSKPHYLVAVPRVLQLIQNSLFKQAP